MIRLHKRQRPEASPGDVEASTDGNGATENVYTDPREARAFVLQHFGLCEVEGFGECNLLILDDGAT